MGPKFRLAVGAVAMPMLFAATVAADPDPSQWWVVPYVQQGSFSPSPPPAGEPLTLTLSGYFPFDCGVIADTNVVATRVAFTMRQGTPGCADTTRSWSYAFPLGALSSGTHTVTLVRTLVLPDGSTEVREGSFEIGVGIAPPPPPVLCPRFSHFTTDPSPATDDAPTRVTLHGCFPYACGEIVDSRILGPTHIEVTMAERSCPDSAQSWAETFDLGLLPAGTHNLIVEVRDASEPWVSYVFGQWLEVTGDAPPPPPPPPPPVTGPLFTGAAPVPSPATTAAATVLVANGFFPYDCGFISDAVVLSPSHVSLTLRRAATCWTDSVRAWSQPFALGVLPAGPHEVRIQLRDAGSADSLTVHEFTAAFEVLDQGPPPPPPPPPPPVDSLLASRPNPFTDRTEFAVVLDEASAVEIGIYDLRGRRVRTIFAGVLGAGERSFAWDGRRDDGRRAAAGVYFYRLIQSGRSLSRRVVLLTGP